MRNKTKKRVNKYFGPGTWERLHPLQREHFINVGAHEIWHQKKMKTLVMPEAPKRIKPSDIVPVELIAKPEVKKGLFARMFG